MVTLVSKVNASVGTAEKLTCADNSPVMRAIERKDFVMFTFLGFLVHLLGEPKALLKR